MNIDEGKMGKSEKHIRLQNLFYQGADLIDLGINSMYNAIIALCEGNESEMENWANETIAIEKKLDQIHDQIINRLFSRETLVFSREDRLFLINFMDEVVDQAEYVVRRMLVHFPSSMPRELIPRLVAISERGNQIGTLLKDTIKMIFTDFDKASSFIPLITDNRREARKDDLLYLEKLFTLDLPVRDFVYFDHLIHNIMKTIDTANTFADGIHRLIVKYKL